MPADEEMGPVDDEPETGPTAGAEDIDLPGTADDPATAEPAGDGLTSFEDR
jgi:hypothetical protein